MVIDAFKYSKNVILCDGDFPRVKLPLSILANARLIVSCDGATDTLVKSGLVPNIIIGDGDSISQANKIKFESIFIKCPDQETNDQTKAVNYLMSKGISDLSILGATGKREDHTIGNISLLIEYMKQGADVKMYTDYGVFIPVTGTVDVKTFPLQQISIFNFSAEKIEAVGLKYPVSRFTNWWQGTLNEAQGETVQISTDGAIVIFLTYSPKKYQ